MKETYTKAEMEFIVFRMGDVLLNSDPINEGEENGDD